MRRARSASQIHARHKTAMSVAAASVVKGLVANYDAVWSAYGKSTAIVVMGGVVINHSVRGPYFKTID